MYFVIDSPLNYGNDDDVDDDAAASVALSVSPAKGDSSHPSQPEENIEGNLTLNGILMSYIGQIFLNKFLFSKEKKQNF